MKAYSFLSLISFDLFNSRRAGTQCAIRIGGSVEIWAACVHTKGGHRESSPRHLVVIFELDSRHPS